MNATQKLLKLAVPMANIQFISILGSFFLMMMMARLGQETLAASALIFSTQACLLLVGGSILFSLSLMIGHACGAQQFLKIGNIVQFGWFLGMLITVPLMIIGDHIKTILILTGQTPSIAAQVDQYFRVFIWAFPALMINITNMQLCYGTHKQHIVKRVNLFNMGVLVFVGYWLIFGKWGAPKLGITGGALGMLISCYCNFFIMLAIFKWNSSFTPFELFRYRLHHEWEILREVWKIGWPMSVQIGGELLSFFFISVMIGWLGTQSLGAFQVTNQYSLLVVVPIFALAQAVGIVIGQANGAQHFNEIKPMGVASMKLTLGITAVIALIFLCFPKELAKLYLHGAHDHDAYFMHLVVMLFMITACIQIIDGLRNILTGALRGLFDTRYPMWVGLGGIWLVGIPLAYIFGFWLHQGVVGIVLGLAVGITVGFGVVWRRWKKLTARF